MVVEMDMDAIESEALLRGWRRIGHKLKGEALNFLTQKSDDGFDALLLGTTERGFLVFDPERFEDGAMIEPFERVRCVTPLSETRTEELRAAFERSRAAA